ncbi:TetR/AcrR family transcriptional regulator [Glycomyces sp. NPDC048151]|uniref:TetR/AcrR family transcriptional regulator n=1 Tax=Glycomyces sp. NPDC048151 TaxID=3364002 RepID=UPI003711A284
MRADAQRNADKLRQAATELFRERGLDAPLKEIARRAGVSHGTLYNLFGTREALINAVLPDLAVDRLEAVATRALDCEDPWEGFVGYLEGLCELQAADPAISDILSGRYPGVGPLMTACDRTFAVTQQIVERARDAGALRPDFAPEDILFILGTNAALARAAADTAPDAWRRFLAFMVDGLRAEAAHPLPGDPLTPAQFFEVLSNFPAKA